MPARVLALLLLVAVTACGEQTPAAKPAASPAPTVAAIGEAPPLEVDGEPACLRATGAPGELAVGGAVETVELLRATKAGLEPEHTLELESCTGVASRPNGAAVAAGDNAGDFVAHLREPGGDWGERIVLDDTQTAAGNVAVAVSDSGAAVVLWAETNVHSARALRFARRLPGGDFGPPTTLANGVVTSLRAAISDAGEAMVMWSSYEDEFDAVHVATVPTSGAFPEPVVVGEVPADNAPALAMGPDGRALVALPGRELRVLERAPGAAFGAPTAVGPISGRAGALAALDKGGAAAIAWTTAAGVELVSRARAGAFTPALMVGRGTSTSLALTPDGQALVSFAAADSVELVTVALGGGDTQARSLPATQPVRHRRPAAGRRRPRARLHRRRARGHDDRAPRPLATAARGEQPRGAHDQPERTHDQRDDRQPVAAVVIGRGRARALGGHGRLGGRRAVGVALAALTVTIGAGLSVPSAPIQRTTSPPE